MALLWTILLMLVLGFVAGLIARALVPGDDSMGLLPTAALGIIGSFVGGILWGLIKYHEFRFTGSGLIGSIIGAIIALLIYNRIAARRAGV